MDADTIRQYLTKTVTGLNISVMDVSSTDVSSPLHVLCLQVPARGQVPVREYEEDRIHESRMQRIEITVTGHQTRISEVFRVKSELTILLAAGPPVLPGGPG